LHSDGPKIVSSLLNDKPRLVLKTHAIEHTKPVLAEYVTVSGQKGSLRERMTANQQVGSSNLPGCTFFSVFSLTAFLIP
jgi:hypothetical protein